MRAVSPGRAADASRTLPETGYRFVAMKRDLQDCGLFSLYAVD
jgi:hypothetical protein